MKRIFAGIIPGILIVGVMVAHANALPNNDQEIDPIEQAKAWAQIDSQPMSADSAVYLQGNIIPCRTRERIYGFGRRSTKYH